MSEITDTDFQMQNSTETQNTNVPSFSIQSFKYRIEVKQGYKNKGKLKSCFIISWLWSLRGNKKNTIADTKNSLKNSRS